MDLIFLHGFLGEPSDWEPVISNLDNEIKTSIYRLDYLTESPLFSKESFAAFVQNFLSWIKNNTFSENKILVGYSLGGRLTMHIMEKFPEVFKKFIIVSSHPGFEDADFEARKERKISDQSWSLKFLKEPWEQVINEWNKQPVFLTQANVEKVLDEINNKKKDLQRKDVEKNRQVLSKALINWSLAVQKNMMPVVLNHSKKIDWVVGELDTKFVLLGEQLKKNVPNLNLHKITHSGHRVIFDNPKDLARIIQNSILENLIMSKLQ